MGGKPEEKGFLEELYLGSFDAARFETLRHLPEVEPEAYSIIDRYRALIRDYPPADLEKAGELPAELLEGLKEIGIFGLNIPKAYGGAGLSIASYLKVLEEVARTDMALALIPTAHLSIGLKGIILFGSEEQKKKYLAPAARGEMIFAYALTEPDTGSDAKNIDTVAVPSEDGGHYILNGSKTYITNANYAGGITVFCQLDPGKKGKLGAFVVETGWEGVNVHADMPKMGLAISSTAAITFRDVSVPAENLLGSPGDGFKIAMTVLNYGRLGLGAASVGIMEQSLEDMLQRSASRKQFGVPIGDFPLVQEKMVRARVHSFVTRAMTAATARLLEQAPLANVALESSHTKLYGTTRAWNTLYDALQTAGGSGYLSTQPYEKRMRDFRVTTVFEGTTEIHSMYPALFLLRSLGKRAGTPYRLLKGLLHCLSWPLRYRERPLKRASAAARRQARRLHRMLHAAALLHGRKAAKKEFFLRRCTHLSLAVFGLLSCIAAIEDERRRGRDAADEMRLLDYFTEEMKEMERRNGGLFDSRKEKVHRRIFRALKEHGLSGVPP